MRKLALIFLTFTLPVLTGCGNPHEKLAANAIAILTEVADALSAIQDSASAEAAKAGLKSLGERWRANERELAEGKPPTTRDLAKIGKKYGAQFDAAVKRYLAEARRVQKIEGGKDALQELGELKGGPALPK
jgi:hypothetical protein